MIDPSTGASLILLHGRSDPQQEMEDWGEDGPCLEGIAWMHFTYGVFQIVFLSKDHCEAARLATGWEEGLDNNGLMFRTAGSSGELVVCEIDGKPMYFGDMEFQAPGWRSKKGESNALI